MQFILLCGCNGSGKSTTAQTMKKMLEASGKTAVVESFATPLKQLATKYLSYNDLYKNNERFKLEDFASDLKSNFGQRLFAYTLLDKVDEIKADYIIVDDLRYSEEFNTISDFFETTVIATADVDVVDSSDRDRLDKLLAYFVKIEYDYVKMKDLSDSTIKEILFGSSD